MVSNLSKDGDSIKPPPLPITWPTQEDVRPEDKNTMIDVLGLSELFNVPEMKLVFFFLSFIFFILIFICKLCAVALKYSGIQCNGIVKTQKAVTLVASSFPGQQGL